MRKLLFLLKKEFRQIRRNPFLARAIILVPLLQMLLLVPAITFEMKRVDLAVTDNDFTPASRELIAKLTGRHSSGSATLRGATGRLKSCSSPETQILCLLFLKASHPTSGG